MIKPIEEIRVANDAIELVQTLRVKHPGLQWAIEACEMKDGKWRVVTVVHGALGLLRYEDSWAFNTRTVQIAARVNEILSQF